MTNPRPVRRARGANDAAKPQAEGLRMLAVDPVSGYVAHVDNRTQAVEAASDVLTLEEASKLMTNVQSAQRNLTEALNHLKLYRQAVSRVLQERRREAAAERKRGQATKVIPPAVDVEGTVFRDSEG